MSDEDSEINDLTEWKLLWLAADSKGHLAILQTMGIGAIPEFLRRSRQRTELIDEFTHEFLKQAEVVGTGHCALDVSRLRRSEEDDKQERQVDARIEGLKRTASLGLYIYSPFATARTIGGYVEEAYPSMVRVLSSLPTEIQNIVGSYRLRINFDRTPDLDRSMWEPASSGSQPPLEHFCPDCQAGLSVARQSECDRCGWLRFPSVRSAWGKSGSSPLCGFSYRFDGTTCSHCGCRL